MAETGSEVPFGARHLSADRIRSRKNTSGSEKKQTVPEDPIGKLRSEFAFSEEGPKSGTKPKDSEKQEQSRPVNDLSPEELALGIGVVQGVKAGVEAIGRAVGGMKSSETSDGEKSKPPLEPPSGGGGSPEVPPPGLPGGEENKERPGRRSFNEVQGDLMRLMNNPNPTKEIELKLERARLLREAKDLGVFDSLKGHMERVQLANNFEEAGKIVKKINISGLENEARGLEGWSDDFEGMLSEYRDVALINMRLALARAGGGNFTSDGERTRVIHELEREIEIRGWGLPPANLGGLAQAYMDNQNPTTEAPANTGALQEMREILTRVEQLFLQRAGQGAGGTLTAEDIARAMGVANPAQQRELYLRAEESLVPLPALDLEVPSFLLGQHGTVEELAREQEEWKARARLTTAAANKRLAPSYDKTFPNQEMIDISRENLKHLMERRGVMEAISAYTALITQDVDPNAFFADPTLGLVDSIFEIKNSDQLLELRDAMKGWLGRAVVGLDEDAARVAEHIAWNITFLSNVVEEYDSRFVHGERGIRTPDVKKYGSRLKHRKHEKRIPPVVPLLKSQPVWMMMHPQDRLEGKVGGKEAFSVFGEWALNNRNRLIFPSRRVPEILPQAMFRNALREIKVGQNKNLFEILIENGLSLTGDRRYAFVSGNEIDWDSVGEGPFGNYNFDTLSPAITVFGVIDKGPNKDKRVSQIGDALRKLGVDRKERENILMGMKGVDSNSRELKPVKGWIWWSDYKNELKNYAPNFFK